MEKEEVPGPGAHTPKHSAGHDREDRVHDIVKREKDAGHHWRGQVIERAEH